MTLRDYDSSSPRRRGGHLNYTCSAGGYNRFASDFNKARYKLTCNDDNNYETPDWPTCVSSKCCHCILEITCIVFAATYCPEPETLETEEIRFHAYSTNTARLEMLKSTQLIAQGYNFFVLHLLTKSLIHRLKTR